MNNVPLLLKTATKSKQNVRLCTFVGVTVASVLKKWREEFKLKKIDEPKESIENILSYCLETKTLADVYRLKKQILEEEEIKKIEFLCKERLKRKPIQYILGEWPFRNLNLKMGPPVFIPRPETEQLVDIVLEEIEKKKISNILELCCGSGAISLALLKECSMINVTALDKSEAACKLTSLNAKNLKVENRLQLIHTDLQSWNYSDCKYDLIVSNPPYIFSEDLVNLQDEIQLYEDLEALDGGPDGLSMIKIILKLSSACLNENGKLYLEVEPRHPRLLCNYLLKNRLGLVYIRSFKDFFAKERFVEIRKI